MNSDIKMLILGQVLKNLTELNLMLIPKGTLKFFEIFTFLNDNKTRFLVIHKMTKIFLPETDETRKKR